MERQPSGFVHEKSHRGDTDTWLTPLKIIRALGEFDFDPCGFPEHWTAKKLLQESHGDDGLSVPWEGRVWLNPPYGPATGVWLDRLVQHGRGTALVFARTDTRWFQRIAPKASALLFMNGRVKFVRPDGTEGQHAAAPSVLIAFGDEDALALSKSRINGWYVKPCKQDLTS